MQVNVSLANQHLYGPSSKVVHKFKARSRLRDNFIKSQVWFPRSYTCIFFFFFGRRDLREVSLGDCLIPDLNSLILCFGKQSHLDGPQSTSYRLSIEVGKVFSLSPSRLRYSDSHGMP